MRRARACVVPPQAVYARSPRFFFAMFGRRAFLGSLETWIDFVPLPLLVYLERSVRSCREARSRSSPSLEPRVSVVAWTERGSRRRTSADDGCVARRARSGAAVVVARDVGV